MRGLFPTLMAVWESTLGALVRFSKAATTSRIKTISTC
jgi:hypothetical protein